MSYPIAIIVSRRPCREIVNHEILTVLCPLCGEEHRYGHDKQMGEDYGHHIAGCSDSYRSKHPGECAIGYVIKEEI